MAAMVAAVVAAASCLRRWSLAVQAREQGRCEEAATLAKRRSLFVPPAQIGGWVLRGCFRRGWLGPALASGLKVGSCAAVPVPQAAPQQFGDTAQRPPAPPAVCSQAAPPAGGARGRRVWLPEWCGCQHAMCSPCRSQHLCSSSAPPAGGEFGAKTHGTRPRFSLDLVFPRGPKLDKGREDRRRAPRWRQNTPYVLLSSRCCCSRAAAGSTLGQGGSS